MKVSSFRSKKFGCVLLGVHNSGKHLGGSVRSNPAQPFLVVGKRMSLLERGAGVRLCVKLCAVSQRSDDPAWPILPIRRRERLITARFPFEHPFTR